jgi:hypothetical protein
MPNTFHIAQLICQIAAAATATTLQAFHAALPKPMPDQIGTKSSGEINAVAWLNSLVQVCRLSVGFGFYS